MSTKNPPFHLFFFGGGGGGGGGGEGGVMFGQTCLGLAL